PYFTSRHKTPWGDALDFSLPPVRRYFVENALRWVSRAAGGFDGLRLDAIHGIYDDSPRHILQEIAEVVHAEGALVIAESDLNDVGGVGAAAAVVALQPALPLYFEGEEWAAREPFQYFVSHTDPALVEAVRKGRQEEFKGFAWSDVPDPFGEETFRRSRIDRSRKDEEALRWHRALLRLRRDHPVLQNDSRQGARASAQGKTLLMRRGPLLVVAAFDPKPSEATLPEGRWRPLLDSGG